MLWPIRRWGYNLTPSRYLQPKVPQIDAQTGKGGGSVGGGDTLTSTVKDALEVVGNEHHIH